MRVVGDLSFSWISSFFFLNLQYRPLSLSLPLCRVSSYLVAYHHPCHTVPSYALPSAWTSYPVHRAKKIVGEEREEKWCHTAMMPEHCLDGGEVEGVWVQRKRWGGRGGSSPMGVVTGDRSRERQAIFPALL